MPTTRRAAAAARARSGPPKGQSTISFATKVTKSVAKDGKKLAAAAPVEAEVPQGSPVLAASRTKQEVVDDVSVDQKLADDEVAAETWQPSPPTAEAELRAQRISDGQVKRYWKSIEDQRKAPRVHQEELRLSEKVLRYFDMSSQYGPCVGISRRRRWQRAERLGLHPPIEVLAVLLKEEEKQEVPRSELETAHIDQILNSTAVGA